MVMGGGVGEVWGVEVAGGACLMGPLPRLPCLRAPCSGFAAGVGLGSWKNLAKGVWMCLTVPWWWCQRGRAPYCLLISWVGALRLWGPVLSEDDGGGPRVGREAQWL